MKKIGIYLCFVALISQVEAQTLDDPIYINYSALPFTTFEDGNEQVDINYIEANMATPGIQIGKKTKLYNAFYYRYNHFEYADDSGDKFLSPFAENLHDLRYSAIVRAEMSEKFELITIARALLRSDLQNELSSRDFFAFGLLLGNFTINSNPNFKIGLGIALNSDFNYNAIIPIATLRYESKKMKIEAVYPNLNVIYKKSPSFEFGLFGTVDGSISRINRSMIGSQEAHFQRNFQVLIAPTVSHRIYKQIFGHLKVGIAPITNFQLLDSNHEEIEILTQRFESSLFIRTGISYRLTK